MTNKTVDILNDVTKTLIDSQKGYQQAAEKVDENYALRSQFLQRADQRQQMINRFQSRVRTFGAEPQTEGGVTGAAHRMWNDFTSMFQSDEKAALNAIDDGEEFLAEQVGDKLDDNEIDMESRQLLRQAYTSAKQGERFAEIMEDRLR